MAAKRTAAIAGLKAARGAPGKRQAVKGGLKLGRRKAQRSPAGTVVLYGQALVGNDQARTELRDAVASARKAYARSSDRRGRLDINALIADRKARREAGNAMASLQLALRTAARRRKKPSSSKGPAIIVLAVAGTGGAAAIAKQRRDRAADHAETDAQQPYRPEPAGSQS